MVNKKSCRRRRVVCRNAHRSSSLFGALRGSPTALRRDAERQERQAPVRGGHRGRGADRGVRRRRHVRPVQLAVQRRGRAQGHRV